MSFKGLLRRLKSVFTVNRKKPSVWVEKLVNEGCFDSQWYLKRYPEVANKSKWKRNPVLHFLEVGGKQGYSPAAWFDSEWYLKYNDDVKRAGVNPVLHYISHGAQEGRKRQSELTLVPDIEPFQFANVSEEGLEFSMPVIGRVRQFQFSILFQQIDKLQENARCGILMLESFDSNGKLINKGIDGLHWSEHLKTWYRYLVQKSIENITSDVFTVVLPDNVAMCKVTFKPWSNAKLAIRNTIMLRSQINYQSGVLQKTLGKPKVSKNRDLVDASTIKVALIADEFSYNSFKDEFQPVVLEPDNWRAQFENEAPELFFCESAWSGIDSVKRPWKGKIYASTNFAKENRTILLDIIKYCNEKAIPTIFWNKEDPTHFTDRIHDFVKTASLFDYVFTSAAECVEGYKSEYGLNNVFALPFATNPKLFNPMTSVERSNRIVFAGSWYANHIERSEVMELILDSLISNGFTPEIYDRYYGDTDPLHIWPDKYLPYINPGQPHDQMPIVYKSSYYGLNFNTVTESSTMFARRVFELMSSNTLVISNYSKGVDEMFGDLVIFADKDPERLTTMTPDDLTLLREKALTKVLSEHTYKQRWRYILNNIGYKVAEEDNSVTLIAKVSTIDEAKDAVRYYEQRFARDNNYSLLILVSSQVPDLDVPGYYQEFNRFGISVTSESFIQKHAQEGLFDPIKSRYFALFSSQNVPSADWLNKMLLHASYLDTDLITTAHVEPYQLTSVGVDDIIAGHKDLFLASLKTQTDGVSLSAYTV